VPSQATQLGVDGGRLVPEQTPVRRVPTPQVTAAMQLAQLRSEEMVAAAVWYCVVEQGVVLLQLD
jgi:hypothetical protein